MAKYQYNKEQYHRIQIDSLEGGVVDIILKPITTMYWEVYDFWQNPSGHYNRTFMEEGPRYQNLYSTLFRRNFNYEGGRFGFGQLPINHLRNRSRTTPEEVDRFCDHTLFITYITSGIGDQHLCPKIIID